MTLQADDIERFKHMVSDLLYLQSVESVRAKVVRQLIQDAMKLDKSLTLWHVYIETMEEKQEEEGIYESGNRGG